MKIKTKVADIILFIALAIGIIASIGYTVIDIMAKIHLLSL